MTDEPRGHIRDICHTVNTTAAPPLKPQVLLDCCKSLSRPASWRYRALMMFASVSRRSLICQVLTLLAENRLSVWLFYPNFSIDFQTNLKYHNIYWYCTWNYICISITFSYRPVLYDAMHTQTQQKRFRSSLSGGTVFVQFRVRWWLWHTILPSASLKMERGKDLAAFFIMLWHEGREFLKNKHHSHMPAAFSHFPASVWR